MKKIFAVALALSLGFASCEPEPEPLVPEIVLGQSEVVIGSEGAAVQVVYNITNPVAGESLTASEDAEWLTVTVGARTIEFSATLNESGEERSASVAVAYAGAEGKTITVKQSAVVEPIVIEVKSVDATAVNFSVKVADSNMRWLPLITEAAVWNDSMTDDELFADDLSYFNYMATYEYGCSLSEFIKMISFVGSPEGVVSYDQLSPSTSYVLYAYGVTLEGERVTDVVKVKFTTAPPYEGDITFDIKVTEENHILNIVIEPSHAGVAYYYDIITDETIAEWQAEYGTTDLKASVQAYINATVEEYIYWGDIYEASEYFDWYSYLHPVNDYYECVANTHYTIYACKWDENCQLLGEISTVEHTSAAVKPSTNYITMTLSNPTQTSVDVATTTTTADPYVIMGVPSSEWEGMSDKQIYAWIMANYGTFYITDFIFEGNVSGTFTGMDPDTEYTFVAFGYEAGEMTTKKMVRATTKTTLAGDPSTCTFKFEWEVGSTGAYVDVTPSDAAHYYYWMIYPADYTAEDVKANIQEIIDEWYMGDISEFAYYELSQGPAGGDVAGLVPDTDYKVAVVIMDRHSGEYLSDVVFSEVFTTPHMTYSKSTVELYHDKYFDGDEIVEWGGKQYANYAGWAVLPVTLTYTGEVADYYYTVFGYKEGYENPELYDDAVFYASLLSNGIYYYEAMDFALNWDTDYLLVGLVVDYDGNYSHLYREKIRLTKEDASPVSEYFNPSASVPSKSAVAWTAFDKQPEALAKRLKVKRERLATDNRYSTEAMKAKRAEAKTKKEELRKESLREELKLRRSARQTDKWEPHYIAK
ncbi:MAG: hypothetical protein J6U53_01430 [Tidjanibacter sp.]|nr:hypothetical protein [Tidjanibacter sp.]